MTGCSCHISPPCNHCVESYECAKCGEIKHPEDSECHDGYVDDSIELICNECFEKREDEG